MSSLSYGHEKATSLPFQIKMWPIDFYTGLYFFFPVGLWHILYEGLHGLVACKAKVVVELGGVVVAVF